MIESLEFDYDITGYFTYKKCIKLLHELENDKVISKIISKFSIGNFIEKYYQLYNYN